MAVTASCHIDKISIVCDSFPELWIDIPSRDGVVESHGISKFPYSYYAKISGGVFIQVADPVAQIRDYRIEYNPADVSEEVVDWFLTRSWNKKVTRCDVAIDYHGEDLLKNYSAVGPHTARASLVYSDRGGRLETVYFGKRSSGDQYRIYDKALQMGEEGKWWRLEREWRPSSNDVDEVLPDDLFDSIYLKKRPWEDSSLSAQQSAMLYYLMNCEGAESKVHANTRAKYRKMMIENGEELKPTVRNVYKKHLNGMRSYIEYLFHENGIQYWQNWRDKEKRLKRAHECWQAFLNRHRVWEFGKDGKTTEKILQFDRELPMFPQDSRVNRME